MPAEPSKAADRADEPVGTDADHAGQSAGSGRGARAGVQSLERAFELLETMADAGGMIGLSQLAADAGLPLPTIHRLVRTLVDLGYVRQEPSRQYVPRPPADPARRERRRAC